jgi:glycosyltransferase involved in cell wall biosynthesis
VKNQQEKKVKVLHVVPSLEMGGIEKGLVDAFQYMDHSLFQLDFLVEADVDTPLAKAARAMGCNIIVIGSFKQLQSFAPAFYKRAKQYDVIHAHTYLFSGLVMLLSFLAGVKRRIAHIHNKHPDKKMLLARGYAKCLTYLIRGFSSKIIAVSSVAASLIYPTKKPQSGKLIIQPMGVDFAKFYAPYDRTAVQKSLGLVEDEAVIVNVSRFSKAKNHDFIIDLFDCLTNKLAFNARLLLIGDGPLRGEIECRVKALGLEEKVIFAGTRYDCHDILRSIRGVFVFPSLFEGLGLVAVEAQAAALPIIMSEHVPQEAFLLDELCHLIPLDKGEEQWAKAARICLEQPSHDRALMLSKVEQSNINIIKFTDMLNTLYRG